MKTALYSLQASPLIMMKQHNYRLKNKGIDVVDFKISIYNRLGQLVYTSNDINFNWNGRHKGKELLTGISLLQ